MIFTPTRIDGAYVITPAAMRDERGYFARTWCEKTFQERGLVSHWAQCSVSFNHRRGTLRGMHYQGAPFAEAKLVRVTRGAIFDVAVDLRPESPTYQNWASAELSADNGHSFYIPAGCAHGFQTIADDAEVYYMISCDYSPMHSRGFHWNDESLDIPWPLVPTMISERDQQLPRAPWVAEAMTASRQSRGACT